MITLMETEGIIPIPVFINGVEAHTIVRDWLTSKHEISGVNSGLIQRDTTYKSNEAVSVDAIVSSIGFPLVGGPAGSMEVRMLMYSYDMIINQMFVHMYPRVVGWKECRFSLFVIN